MSTTPPDGPPPIPEPPSGTSSHPSTPPHGATGSSLASQMAAASLQLERMAAEQLASHQQEAAAKKGTGKCYERHPERYEQWWAEREAALVEEAAAKGTVHLPIPAHPITGAKVAIFMQEDRFRACVSAESTVRDCSDNARIDRPSWPSDTQHHGWLADDYPSDQRPRVSSPESM